MNPLRLSLAYLRARWLNTLLNVFLLAAGMGTIVLVLLFSHQLEDKLSRDAHGIDLVVGAKGSPMQLILSSIYHLDVPTGNIPLKEAEKLMRHRYIKTAIPLALGDSYRGFRIVCSSLDYPHHYQAGLAQGRLWQAPLEATLGARAAEVTALQLNGTFMGAHGLVDGGEAHAGSPYHVVGILKPTGTALDNLILTGVESVWQVHREHGHGGGDEEEGRETQEETREITALLLKYRTPLAAVTLPRYVNSQSSLQAASPAFEIARLLQLVGVGTDTLRAFGVLLIVAAGSSVFAALYHALQERRHDLALMRTLGASRGVLMGHLLLEGLLLTIAGAVVGLLLGHSGAEVLGQWLMSMNRFNITGLVWLKEEFWLCGGALLLGILAALVPAIQAYRTDVAAVLSRG